MRSRVFGPMPWAWIAGVCLLLGMKATGQTPGASASPAAQGALPEYIEEFFLSEAVRSEERGELQLTADAMGFKGRGNTMDSKSAGLDIEYGITRRLQFGMELPYGIQSTATSELPANWSTVNASVLYQFIRSNHPFALSGALGANLPVSGRGSASFEPELMAAKGFGKLQIHASLIPELGGDDRALEYNVAAVRPWARNWISTLEFIGRRNGGVNSFYATPGIYKHLPHRLEIGLGVPVGAGPHSSPVGAVVKMTWEMGGDDDD